MIYQHRAGRFRYHTFNSGKQGLEVRKPIGTAAQVGDIRDVGSRGVRPDRVIVEAWLNRDYCAHHKDSAGHWQSVKMSGGHLAQVRSLRTRRVYALAEQYLRDPDDY